MRAPSSIRHLLALCLLTLLPVAATDAQSAGATITIAGVVLDPMRAPIAGARVTAGAADSADLTIAAASAVTGVTDETGRFALTVARGRYRLRVMADGFTEAERIVEAGLGSAAARLEIVLPVQGVQETVTVAAAVPIHPPTITTATKTATPLVNVPQAVTVIGRELIRDQMMMSVGDVLRYVPGVMVHQGENNRDQVIIRGNSSSADFFVDGVRDDVQYYRDVYNLARVETLKGPNAMIFGRGGAGGVVNRVSKVADFGAAREFSAQAGMFGNRRVTGGLNQPLSGRVALRLDGMFENSDSFRNQVSLERGGITPTATILASPNTSITVRYEYLRDRRTADRGITSFLGRPADVAFDTFYGDPNQSAVRADVNLGSITLQHQVGRVTIRNHTLAGRYERFYQNFVPGVVSGDRALVALTAYNNTTNRTNLFNQTDVTIPAATGRLRHTLLAGAEFGRQLTDNLRQTGYFNNLSTSVQAPFTNPTIATPITFRPSATDADNQVTTRVAAAYVQDQVELSAHVQLLAGLRFDRFDLTYHNNRTGDTLARPDDLVSPRAGLIYKPIADASVYASYGVSYLPSSGDQFSSLTTITQQVKPEQFRNYEVGAKWDATPSLALTTAVYRLDRANTCSTDPNDPTRIVQTGSQRTSGYEIGASGSVTRHWSLAGGFAWQNAFVRSATTAAAAGAQVGQVPHQTLSLWNRYQLHARIAAALGIQRRSDMFATIDNSVRLPGYTRVDAAGFFSLTPAVRLQVNVENLLDRRYIVNADSNTNLSPGFPRAVRVGLTTSF